MTGHILAWRDALHEGPVGGSAERARLIADRGWAPFEETLALLTARDERLQRAIVTHEDITLWFETDLYDVLQLAQIRAARPEPFDPAPYRALWRAFAAPDPAR